MPTSRLPATRISLRRRLLIFLPIFAVLYTVYLWTNHVHLFQPILLPLTALDRAIPFYVWTVWPYLLLAYCLLGSLFLSDVRLFRQAVWALVSGYSVNLIVFVLLPTALPRLPVASGDGWSLAAYRSLCALDSPANCFPSGHITASAIAFWFLAQQYPRWRPALAVVFALLACTILTTKQHYAWDLPGGLATAAFGIGVAGLLERRRSVAA